MPEPGKPQERGASRGNSTKMSVHTSEEAALYQTMLEEGIYKIVYDNDYPIDTFPGSDWEAIRRFMRDGPAIDKLNAEATVIFPFLQDAIEKDWNEKNLLIDVISAIIRQ